MEFEAELSLRESPSNIFMNLPYSNFSFFPLSLILYFLSKNCQGYGIQDLFNHHYHYIFILGEYFLTIFY